MREYGGAERSLEIILPALAEQVPLIVLAENERHLANLRAMSGERLRVVPMPHGNSPRALLSALLRLHREIAVARPTAVLANGHKGGLLLALARLSGGLRGARPLLYVRDFAWSLLPFILRALPHVGVLAPSQSVFAFAKYQRAGLRGKVVTNAVVAPEQPPPLPTVPRIVCLARLHPFKGVDRLIAAFANIAPSFPTAELHIYGDAADTAYAARLREQARPLGSRVVFHPFVSEPAEIFSTATLAVVPSLSLPPGPETFSRVVIEAWAWARPVVAFDCGGPHYLIRHGEDGFLVAENDVAALSARIAELLNDPTLCQRLAAAGRSRAVREHTPRAVAEGVWKITRVE